MKTESSHPRFQHAPVPCTGRIIEEVHVHQGEGVFSALRLQVESLDNSDLLAVILSHTLRGETLLALSLRELPIFFLAMVAAASDYCGAALPIHCLRKLYKPNADTCTTVLRLRAYAAVLLHRGGPHSRSPGELSIINHSLT